MVRRAALHDAPMMAVSGLMRGNRLHEIANVVQDGPNSLQQSSIREIKY
jgi:hypothetical protein